MISLVLDEHVMILLREANRVLQVGIDVITSYDVCRFKSNFYTVLT